MIDMRYVYKILVGKPKEKRLLGRSRSRLENNIRMDLREIGWKLWAGCFCFRLGAIDVLLRIR